MVPDHADAHGSSDSRIKRLREWDYLQKDDDIKNDGCKCSRLNVLNNICMREFCVYMRSKILTI